MALKKFIKAYNIPVEYVNKDGSIREDAPLYPLYFNYTAGDKGAPFWHDMSADEIQDRLNTKDIEYDNSLNSKKDKQYKLHFADGSESKMIGPNTKRGYSVAAYSNKDKRNGNDYFSDWYPNPYAAEEATYYGNNSLENSEKYQNTASNEQLDKKNSLSVIPSKAREQTKGNKPFFTVPLIVTADTSDVININDVLKDNYEPGRDDFSEVQLKRIISKAAMPDMFSSISQNYHTQVGIDNAIAATLKAKDDLDTAAVNFSDALNAFSANPQRRYNYVRLNAILFDVVRVCDSIVKKCTEAIMPLSSDNDPSIQKVLTSINGLGFYGKTFKDIWNNNDYDTISENVSKVVKDLPEVQNILDSITSQLHSITNGKNSDSQIVVPNPNFDISKYFDWNSDETYSDERLKDVYGSCHDVQLPNSMLQQIASDFVSYLLKSDNQGLITNAVKEFRI